MNRVIAGIALALFAGAGQAQITVNSTDGALWGISYTPTAGTDRLLVACATGNGNGTGAQDQTDITNITLGGTGMGLDAEETRYASSPDDCSNDGGDAVCEGGVKRRRSCLARMDTFVVRAPRDQAGRF